MPGNQQNQGDEVGEEIVIPTAKVDGAAITETDLFKLQDETFSSEKKEEKKNGKSQDRATEIFSKTQKFKKEQTQIDSNEEEGEDEEGLQFDAARFLDDQQEQEDENENNEEEEGGDTTESSSGTKEDNIKNLRQLVGRYKNEKEAFEAKVRELEQAAGSADVKALQGQIAQLKSRVAGLEPYEFVYALHENPAFKAKYIDGAEALVSEMTEIVKDYGVDESVVENILYAQNRRELDEFLDDTFASTTTRLDLKNLKQRYDGLIRERAEHEKKPKEALEGLNSERAQQETENITKRDNHLNTIIKDGWTLAINQAGSLPPEQKIYEVVEIPGKKDHNEKVVRPTLQEAQKMFQVIMNYVEKVGRNKYLPTGDFAAYVANLCQQAAATQTIHQTRMGLYKNYRKLLDEKTERENSGRPAINSPSRKGSKGTRKKSLENAAAEIFADVLKDTT